MSRRMVPEQFPRWQGVDALDARTYMCGHCGSQVGSDKGWSAVQPNHVIYICPGCGHPTYFHYRTQVPGVLYGGDVEYVPPESAAIYREARNCMTVNAYTAVVMLCRTLLMHIAVAEGANEGKDFTFYIKHLVDTGYVAPKSRPWVDQIRQKGNLANHKIAPVSREDAEEMIALSQMVLQLVYEFPSRMPPPHV